MQTKARTLVNTLLSAVLGMLGFATTSCNMYGTPVLMFTLDGKVTNEDYMPLQNIEICVKHITNGGPKTHDVYAYTDNIGYYRTKPYDAFGSDVFTVIASDTSGVYMADTTIIYSKEIVYKHSSSWTSNGSASAVFVLKKNNEQ